VQLISDLLVEFGLGNEMHHLFFAKAKFRVERPLVPRFRVSTG
jgi:hypothetical protein